MIEIYLNGLRLIQNHDYIVEPAGVCFTEAPCIGDRISVSRPIFGSTGGRLLEMHIGNGTTCLYPLNNQFNDRVEIQNLLDDVYTYQHVPAVAEALEKLKVVIGLIKECPTN
jgi:hypothetical protein